MVEGSRGPEHHVEPAWAMFAADEASLALGITLVDAADGRAEVRMPVTEQMVNGHGIAHGGYVFLFADTAFASGETWVGDQLVASVATLIATRRPVGTAAPASPG